jgi:hypothetical protein
VAPTPSSGGRRSSGWSRRAEASGTPPVLCSTVGIPVQGELFRPGPATTCIPLAGDWFVLQEVNQAPAGLVACASLLGETVHQTAERLIKYAPFMVDVDMIIAGAASFVPEPQDAIFLSRDADGKAPWLQGTPNLIHILEVARAIGRPVESVLAQYHRYEFLDIHPPTFSREELEAALPKDEADELLLTRTSDKTSRRPGEVSFMVLVQTAVKTRRPLGALLERVYSFENVGVTLEPVDLVPIPDCQLEGVDLRDLALLNSISRGIGLGPLLAAIVKGRGERLFVTATRSSSCFRKLFIT